MSANNSKSNNRINKWYIENIDKNNISEKLIEYENNIRGLQTEYSYVIRSNGDVYLYKGDGKSVNIEIDDKSIITHNHPLDDGIYRSFGEDDYYFIKDNKFKELRLVNPDYDYKIIKLKEFKNISYNEIYLEAMEKYNWQEDFEIQHEAMKKYNWQEDFEIQHEAMKILDEREFVKYERRTRKNI